MINLSSVNDKVFKARRNSNKDVYYIDLQEKYYMEAMEWLGYLLQGFYEDFYVTGKWLLEKLSIDDFQWLIKNFNVLHTQDGKYVFEEMKRVRGIED